MYDRGPFLDFSLTVTSSSMGVGRSNGKEWRKTYMFLLFLPIMTISSHHGHFLLEPRKGLEGLGQAGGQMASAVREMNCLDYEVHLWKLSCHCLCSEANDVPHYL